MRRHRLLTALAGGLLPAARRVAARRTAPRSAARLAVGNVERAVAVLAPQRRRGRFQGRPACPAPTELVLVRHGRPTRCMPAGGIAAFPAAIGGVGLAVSEVSSTLQTPSGTAEHAQCLPLSRKVGRGGEASCFDAVFFTAETRWSPHPSGTGELNTAVPANEHGRSAGLPDTAVRAVLRQPVPMTDVCTAHGASSHRALHRHAPLSPRPSATAGPQGPHDRGPADPRPASRLPHLLAARTPGQPAVSPRGITTAGLSLPGKARTEHGHRRHNRHAWLRPGRQLPP